MLGSNELNGILMDIVQYVIKFGFGVLLGVGAYMIIADIMKFPTIKSSKAIRSVYKRQNENVSSIDVWLGNLASFIAKHIHMNEYKYLELKADLRTAQMDITPEMHIANSVVKSLIGVVLSVPLFFLHPLAGAAVLGTAIALFFVNKNSVRNRIKGHRIRIENDLPRLVSTIQKKLTHERGIISILESFIPSCGPELKQELEITVADMRSGNEEAAISRLEARVGSPMMSDVCRGFATMIHGDKAEVYWASIEQKFADIQRNRLRAEASKVPGKIRRLSMVLLFCFVAIFIVVIIRQIMDSLGMMF